MRERLARSLILVAMILAAGFPLGCGGPKPAPAPARPPVPLAIRPGSAMRVFSGEEETPGTAYEFQGAQGSVRVTMEVEGAPGGNAVNAAPPIINDVLFKADGDGRISVAFKRPSPEHPNGRVSIQCLSGDEESSAVFEPELWYHLPGAIVTLEPANTEAKEQAVSGKELVLGRYVARNIPRDVSLDLQSHLHQRAGRAEDEIQPQNLLAEFLGRLRD